MSEQQIYSVVFFIKLKTSTNGFDFLVEKGLTMQSLNKVFYSYPKEQTKDEYQHWFSLNSFSTLFSSLSVNRDDCTERPLYVTESFSMLWNCWYKS